MIRLLSRPPDALASAEQQHNARAAWLESILVDRRHLRGSAGKEIERAIAQRPLAPDEQACADRTAERICHAQSDLIRRPPIVEAFRKLLR